MKAPSAGDRPFQPRVRGTSQPLWRTDYVRHCMKMVVGGGAAFVPHQDHSDAGSIRSNSRCCSWTATVRIITSEHTTAPIVQTIIAAISASALLQSHMPFAQV